VSKPNLVLLDIGMPDMDGYEVARRVRVEPDFADVPIVAMTGHGQEGDRTRSAEAGINTHLVKPVEIAALQALSDLVVSAARTKRVSAEHAGLVWSLAASHGH